MDHVLPGNPQDLADHVLEDLDVDFRSKLEKGDVLVAGTNFGCGSSREQAPLALKVAGVSAVVAKYFARIFFRNAINIGMPVLEVPDLEVCTAISADGRVTIGHNATLHGCTIGDRVLVGMGATVMDGAVVEDEAVIAAGALVTPLQPQAALQGE